METSVGWSLDGREFACSGPLSAGLPLGGYVRVRPPDGPARVGQVLEQQVDRTPIGRRVLSQGLLVDPQSRRWPFDDAEVEVATDDEIRGALAAGEGMLEVGHLRGRPDVGAAVVAGGFNRHTFLCGQSGSGKTYSLGVLLERLLLRTRLPMVVLDPNGDHVHLPEVRPDVAPETAAAYRAATAGVRVLRATPGPGEEALRVRLDDLGREGAGALLELDPVTDRQEYNALIHFREEYPRRAWETVGDFMDALRGNLAEDDRVAGMLLRMENLGIDEMSLWALGQESLASTWQTGPRAIVADTSGFETRRERTAVAVATLRDLWAKRVARRPVLLVVDEAHDVCPAEPTDLLQAQAVDLFERIAGEGRKFGIHLLLASQRPDKLPDNVLSQCDNLVLMRVNSASDRAALASRFTFAPRGLVELAGRFDLGEALVAGRIARPPAVVRIGQRLAPEGGGDLSTDWALPASAPG